LIPLAEPDVAAELLFISDFLITAMETLLRTFFDILATLSFMHAACQTQSPAAFFLKLLISLRVPVRRKNRPARTPAALW
jgi:hypothetical protein